MIDVVRNAHGTHWQRTKICCVGAVVRRSLLCWLLSRFVPSTLTWLEALLHCPAEHVRIL